MEYPEKELTEKIIGAAIAVHKYWGPGLIESVYEKSLARELELQGIEHQRQVDLKLEYIRSRSWRWATLRLDC